MKRTTQGFRAHELEHLEATSYGGFTSKKIYVIEDVAGLYRKLPKEAKKNRDPLAVACFLGDGLVDLKRDLDLERELAEAGLVHVDFIESAVAVARRSMESVVRSLFASDDEQCNGEIANQAVDHDVIYADDRRYETSCAEPAHELNGSAQEIEL